MVSRSNSVEVRIFGDIGDISRKLKTLESQSGTTSTTVTDKMTKAGRAIQAGFGAVAGSAILKVAADLDKLAVQSEGIRNRFNTVFGDMSGEMLRWADDVNERFGTSVESVQDMANSIQDVLVPIGFTREAAADLTREVLSTSDALSEWTGGQIETADAAERVRKALLGEREGVEELGVKILQSDVNARLAAQGQQQLTGEAKAQAEALATLEIITEKSSDALDAYAKGANKAYIEQKRLNAALEDGKQSLGEFVKREADFAREQAGQLTSALEDLGYVIDNLKDGTDDAAESQKSWTERIIESEPAFTFAATLAVGLRQGLASVRGELEDSGPQLDQYVTRAGRLHGGLRQVQDDAKGAAGGVSELTEALTRNQEKIRELTDPLFRLRKAEEKLNEAQRARVEAQTSNVPQRAVDDAILAEVQAFQDLQFARENATGVFEQGFGIIERYAAEAGIAAENIKRITDETYELDRALRGLPTDPFSGLGGIDPRRLESELARRRQQVVE